MDYKKQFLDTLIILSLTLLIFAALEMGLRLIYPDKVNKHIQPYEYGGPFLRALRPNIRATFHRSQANGGDIIRWKTNEHGFRGDELLIGPDARVMVYGDSSIQARFTQLQNTFPHKLQEYLNALTEKISKLSMRG